MTPKNAEPESKQWKDSVNRDIVANMAEKIGLVEPSFDRAAFVKAVVADDLDRRELKDRVATIARHLNTFLPENYAKAVDILLAVAPQVDGWSNWALTTYVELFGVEHFDDSVRALEELTKHGSGEFAIRPFMIRYTEQMLKVVDRWTKNPNEHVRRLAAEGTRPRGVWMPHVEQFRKNPTPVIKILDKLRADKSLYVRKAVANNLNDISKDHPDIAIKTALRWQKDKNRHTDWIIKHGCRTLIKQGHPEVFPLLGFTSSPNVKIDNLKIKPKRVAIGKQISISFDLVSKASKKQKLVIDYMVHYVKSNGKLSPKVFKLTQKDLRPKEAISIATKHSFVERSTRKHFPGKHRLEILVNGTRHASVDFAVSK